MNVDPNTIANIRRNSRKLSEELTLVTDKNADEVRTLAYNLIDELTDLRRQINENLIVSESNIQS